MAEKNILAYFNTPEQAEEVKAKLMALRAVEVSIDRFGMYPGTGMNSIMNPTTGDVPSLATMTLNAGISSPGAGILAAASVSASGMSDGGQGGPTGRDILLTAVVDEDNHHQALQVIRDAGGQM
ncbi:hypothetical protein SY83_14625 [Paenibacillus swuensis]|uniref:Uncharacterized protein n=1 Tax=Paenibacillus swuensis TaxID=1178515 RepID=A0A172TJR7_9BACL|nr:hypothetical protein [Paenibacillus swuensis]ANE47295.1 hypothetical protein SY83_14625 [Paenibacillus swuensis]